MKTAYYIPIYSWGSDPSKVEGATTGATLYWELKDLWGFEPEAVGYFEVFGNIPTKEEFEKSQK